jgi:hypothetical protein
MRYEHIELDISTAACAVILNALEEHTPDNGLAKETEIELANLKNELRARLQRRDVDVHCPKNFPVPVQTDWMDT